jgi:hypothetical protein
VLAAEAGVVPQRPQELQVRGVTRVTPRVTAGDVSSGCDGQQQRIAGQDDRGDVVEVEVDGAGPQLL